ncbi:putative transcription factor MYB-HB-like family [Helianthus anomalus]
MSSNMHFFGNFSLNDYSSESITPTCAFMESPSHQLCSSFPNFEQFVSQEASPNSFLVGPTQSYDTSDAYQISASRSDLLEPPMRQPEITQPVLEPENNKKTTGRKNKKNVESKGKVDKRQRQKVSVRHRWSKYEDRLLMQLVEQHGEKNWAHIAEKFPLRIAKQCRDRWHNCLSPNIVKYGWSEEDDKLLISLHKQFGNKWADIARNMPGRCENSIKNHWNATKRNQFKISSNGYIKTKYHSYLLKDYITSISSSSSDNQINTQESSGFDPQNHEYTTSLNARSSSFPGSWVGYKPDELVVDGIGFDFHEVSSHLVDQLQFDSQNVTGFIGSPFGVGFR